MRNETYRSLLRGRNLCLLLAVPLIVAAVLVGWKAFAPAPADSDTEGTGLPAESSASQPPAVSSPDGEGNAPIAGEEDGEQNKGEEIPPMEDTSPGEDKDSESKKDEEPGSTDVSGFPATPAPPPIQTGPAATADGPE